MAACTALCLEGVSKKIFDFAYGAPSGSKQEEMSRLNVAGAAKKILASEDIYSRLRELSGPYPESMTPLIMRHGASSTDRQVQAQFAHFLAKKMEKSTFEAYCDTLPTAAKERLTCRELFLCRGEDVARGLATFPCIERLTICCICDAEAFKKVFPKTVRHITFKGDVDLLATLKEVGFTGTISCEGVDFRGLSDEILELLGSFLKTAVTVQLTGCTFGDGQLATVLSRAASADKLVLDETSALFSELSSLDAPRLSSLSWRHCPDEYDVSVGYEDLANALAALTTLDLTGSSLKTLTFLEKGRQTLEELLLADCARLNDGAFAGIGTCPKLRRLDLTRCLCTSYPFWDMAVKMPALERLVMTGVVRPREYVYTGGHSDEFALPNTVTELVGAQHEWKRKDGVIIPVTEES